MILSNENLLEYLKTHALGAGNVVQGREIVLHLMGEYSAGLDRQLRNSVRYLREMGYPIVSNGFGYYWAQSPEELAIFFSFLRARAFSSLKIVAKMLRIALPDIQGQLRLPVDSEPKPMGFIAWESKGMVDLRFELPIELYLEYQEYLDKNPDCDCNTVASSALALYLLQQGVASRDLSNIYLSNLKEEEDATD